MPLDAPVKRDRTLTAWALAAAQGRWLEMKKQRQEWAERIERAAGARYRTVAQQQQDAAAEAAAAAATGMVEDYGTEEEEEGARRAR